MTMAKITPRTLSGFMELLTRREPLFFIQTGRSEFGLFQGFAAQNAWDAAALRGKSSRQTPDDESLTVPLGNS